MIRMRWEGNSLRELHERFHREAAREIRRDMHRIGQGFRRVMFDRFKAPIAGPPFFENLSDDLLKSRTGALRSTVGYEVTGERLRELRLQLYAGDAQTARYVRIQEHGGTIKAKSGKYLTIPLPDNLTGSRGARAGADVRFPSARALFESERGRVAIVRSKAGNLVVAYRPGRAMFGKGAKDTHYLWLLKPSVTLKPRLGFGKTAGGMLRAAIRRELRDALARAIRTTRRAAAARSAGKGTAF